MRWSLTVDRGFYLKNLLNVFVVLSLLFIAFTTHFFHIIVMGENADYTMCFIVTMVMFIITVVTGPSWMFSSMKSKHDLQTLLMLPASNLEKYLMRYSTWILLLPLYIVAFFGADLVQYLVNVIWGNENLAFVTTEVINDLSDTFTKLSKEDPRNMWHGGIATMLLFHSVYTLGGTFFRSHKFAWILTTVVIIVVCMLCIWLLPQGTGYSDKDSAQVTSGWDVFYAVWFLGNFWLSYRLFCRQQVIGKFVNL
jgi:hypothetical protein